MAAPDEVVIVHLTLWDQVPYKKPQFLGERRIGLKIKQTWMKNKTNMNEK